MDTSTFIERLNEDLGTEYQPIAEYIEHIATIKGHEYHSITEELANHLGQELQHAEDSCPADRFSRWYADVKFRTSPTHRMERQRSKPTWS